ncbi:MAG: hypothetical protein RLZZ436_81 [Planctomycetota bacterium]
MNSDASAHLRSCVSAAAGGLVPRHRFSGLLIGLLLAAALLLFPCSQPAIAQSPTELPLELQIDASIDQQNSTAGVPAVEQADADTLLRRTTLDLAGRIPTAKERDWYLALPAQTRQQLLVDRLLQLPDFDFHLRNSLDELLLPERPNDGEFREYLLTAVRERRPWSRMFREMLMASSVDGPDKGAAQFLKSRVRELDDLTNDTAVLFFGVNISCAKCHDHPLVSDWKQDHYYGMQAFFQRTFSSKKNVLLENPLGSVRFKTTAGEDRDAKFMFLTGAVVADATPTLTDEEKKAIEEQVRRLEREDDAQPITVSFSPRQALIETALADQQLYLARNIVNRTWARLLGTGFVDPPDQMHSGNPASHPQLLSDLAADFVQHDYDLRRLIRGIVLSRTYARSSRWTSEAAPPAAQTFAVAAARPLTPRQLAASLQIAVRSSDSWPSVEETLAKPDDWLKRRTDIENQAGAWMREFEQPAADFQIAVDEALFFSNSDRVQSDLLRDGGDRLVGALRSAETPELAAAELWRVVCGREPSAEEIEVVRGWLARAPERRVSDMQSLVWALLAGAEFRFNH